MSRWDHDCFSPLHWQKLYSCRSDGRPELTLTALDALAQTGDVDAIPHLVRLAAAAGKPQIAEESRRRLAQLYRVRDHQRIGGELPRAAHAPVRGLQRRSVEVCAPEAEPLVRPDPGAGST